MYTVLVVVLALCLAVMCGLLCSVRTALEYQRRIRNFFELKKLVQEAKERKFPRQQRIEEAERHLRCVRKELTKESPNISFVDKSLELGFGCLNDWS